MRKQTNLVEVKQTALALLSTEINETPYHHAKEIVENSKNNKSKVVIVPNSNHTFNVLIPNASKANDVIEITLKWIKNILQIN